MPEAGVAAKITPLSVGLEKNIVRGVLGLVRLAKKPEGQIKNLTAVDPIQLRKFVRLQFLSWKFGAVGFTLN